MCIDLDEDVLCLFVSCFITGGAEHSPCSAMQSILSDLEPALGSSWLCTTTDPCFEAICRTSNHNRVLKIELLRCALPQAIRLVHLSDGSVVFNHTLYHSAVFSATFDGSDVEFNVTVVHHPDLFGVRVSVVYNNVRHL